MDSSNSAKSVFPKAFTRKRIFFSKRIFFKNNHKGSCFLEMSTEGNGTLSTATSTSNIEDGVDTLKSNPSSSAELLAAENVDPKELYKNVDENNTESLEEGDRSILVQLLRQVFAGGLDLTKVTMPVNFLEPRSMLEKLTDFMTHAHMLATFVSIPKCFFVFLNPLF